MNRRAFLLAILIVAVTAAGCRESQSSLSPEDVTIDLEVSEFMDGVSVLIVEILDDDGAELPVQSLVVRGDMNHAGMIPVIVDMSDAETLTLNKSTEPGVYLVPFEWSMGGEWILSVEVTFLDNDDQTVEASEQFTLDITEDMLSSDADMAGMDMSGDMEMTPEATAPTEATPEIESAGDGG